MKYYLKNKEQLAKLGIHSLQRTPGKLITAKGHIDGYLSAYGIVWGKLGMTGEQAQKAMGFTPKKGAVGVFLTRRRYIDKNGNIKKGIFAASLMPYSSVLTKKRFLVQQRIKIISKFASKHSHDLIHPVWEPLVIHKHRKPYGGFYYFISLNAKNIGVHLDWKKFLVSNGKLSPPSRAPGNWFNQEENQIHFLLPKTSKAQPFDVCQIGIAIFDLITADSFLIPPPSLTKLLYQNLNTLLRNESLYLTWTPQKVNNYNYKSRGQLFRTIRSRFFGYVYYKAPQNLPFPQDHPNYDKIHHSIRSNYTPYYPDFLVPDPLYSPSLSFRIRLAKNRTNPTNRFHLIIQIS